MTTKPDTTRTPRATAVGGPGGWHGAIKIGRRTVWACPHAHQNRDITTTVNYAAHSCAGVVLLAATEPEKFEASRQWSARYSRSAADAEFARRLNEWAASVAPEVRAALEAANA